MNCPACNRDLASTLSVCPSCGTMVHDSVREELALKISPIIKSPKVEINKVAINKTDLKEKSLPPVMPVMAPVMEIREKPLLPVYVETQMPSVNKPHTSEIKVKTTGPTLVEFHNKNAALPEWRLQLQNTIRIRNERYSSNNPSASVMTSVPQRTSLTTNGATALKADPYERIEPIPAVNPIIASNPTLAKAMQRIEQSRQKFYVEEIKHVEQPVPAQPSPKTFPHAVPSKPQEFLPKNNYSETFSGIGVNSKISEPVCEPKAKFDTNKLPTLPKIGSDYQGTSISITKVDLNVDDDLLEIHTTASPDVIAYSDGELADQILEIDDADIDDCAPIALRFNSAVFDLIIASFASLVLLSPFMIFNGKFFSVEGLFAFLATCSIVMFIYMTTTIGLLGKTFGMKLFSLEVIDIEGNDYPTLHQAAVSSAVYLLSLALGGLGFLTLLINSEKRAAHDLLSGTIIVKDNQ